MPAQIPLFQQFHGVSFDNYWPGDNAKAIELIKGQITVPDQPCLFLWGKPGVGKSHLLQAACSYAQQQEMPAVYIPLAELNHMEPGIFQELENYSLICIDDVDAIAKHAEWESALFHLFNRASERGTVMIFAATHKPADLAIQLPDLRSRLAWGTVWHMQELPDEDKLAALQLHARQRGFLLPEEVGNYLLQRWPRDMHSLFALLEKLDQASLAEHRKLTIPFVRKFL
jgi:DnaA family protein